MKVEENTSLCSSGVLDSGGKPCSLVNNYSVAIFKWWEFNMCHNIASSSIGDLPIGDVGCFLTCME